MFDVERSELLNAIGFARSSLAIALALLVVGTLLASLRTMSRRTSVRALTLVALAAAPLVVASTLPALRSTVRNIGDAGMREFATTDEQVSRQLHDEHGDLIRDGAMEVNDASWHLFVGTRLRVSVDGGKLSYLPTAMTWVRIGLIGFVSVAAGLAFAGCLRSSASKFTVVAASAAFMLLLACCLSWQSLEISELSSGANLVEAVDAIDPGRSG